jgi:hypothetical protein
VFGNIPEEASVSVGIETLGAMLRSDLLNAGTARARLRSFSEQPKVCEW